MPHIDWRKLYEAAMLEMNPDKLAICIGAAEQATAQQESSPDVTQLERRKLTDARSMLDIVCRLEPPAAIEVSGEPGITIRWAAGRNNRNSVRLSGEGAAPGRTTRLLPGQKSAESPSPDGGYGFPSSRSFPSNSRDHVARLVPWRAARSYNAASVESRYVSRVPSVTKCD